MVWVLRCVSGFLVLHLNLLLARSRTGSVCTGLVGRRCVVAEDGCASRTSMGGSPTLATDRGFLRGQNLGELGLGARTL